MRTLPIVLAGLALGTLAIGCRTTEEEDDTDVDRGAASQSGGDIEGARGEGLGAFYGPESERAVGISEWRLERDRIVGRDNLGVPVLAIAWLGSRATFTLRKRLPGLKTAAGATFETNEKLELLGDTIDVKDSVVFARPSRCNRDVPCWYDAFWTAFSADLRAARETYAAPKEQLCEWGTAQIAHTGVRRDLAEKRRPSVCRDYELTLATSGLAAAACGGCLYVAGATLALAPVPGVDLGGVLGSFIACTTCAYGAGVSLPTVATCEACSYRWAE
jgi:hypothetical protein